MTGKPMMMKIHQYGRPVFSAWNAKQSWMNSSTAPRIGMSFSPPALRYRARPGPANHYFLQSLCAEQPSACARAFAHPAQRLGFLGEGLDPRAAIDRYVLHVLGHPRA